MWRLDLGQGCVLVDEQVNMHSFRMGYTRIGVLVVYVEVQNTFKVTLATILIFH